MLGDAGAFGFWKEIFQMMGMSFRVSNKTPPSSPTLELVLTLPDGHRVFCSASPGHLILHLAGPFY